MSVELFRRAAAGDFAPEVLHYLSESARRHRAGLDLECAYGLDRASRERECRRALCEADALLTAGASLGITCRAKRLAAAIKRFDGRLAPLLARDPQMDLAPIDDAVRRALDAGRDLRMPTTDRNLRAWIR